MREKEMKEPGKRLGTWKVKRAGNNQIVITIPDGMKIVGEELTIEDILGAVANYMVVKRGRILACCSGNIAIA